MIEFQIQTIELGHNIWYMDNAHLINPHLYPTRPNGNQRTHLDVKETRMRVKQKGTTNK